MAVVNLPDLQAEWLSVKLLACVIFASAIIALLFVLVYFGRENFAQTFVKAMVVALPAAAMAYVAGYLTGISRSPAVGTVLPAVLAVLAGANIYFAEPERRHAVWFGYGAFTFAVLFYYGISSGILERETGRVDWLIDLSRQENAVRNWRVNRGLPPDLSPWIEQR